MEKRWVGYYIKGTFKASMTLNLVWHDQEKRISGLGQDVAGQYSWSGCFDRKGNVTMAKTYTNGTAVHFTGKLKGKEMKGSWNIGNFYCGTFYICQAKAKPRSLIA
ncbi:hypothetical protein QOT17_013568 [Balamuthia mandrillaris]